jgi:hypothetical protein
MLFQDIRELWWHAELMKQVQPFERLNTLIHHRNATQTFLEMVCQDVSMILEDNETKDMAQKEPRWKGVIAKEILRLVFDEGKKIDEILRFTQLKFSEKKELLEWYLFDIFSKESWDIIAQKKDDEVDGDEWALRVQMLLEEKKAFSMYFTVTYKDPSSTTRRENVWVVTFTKDITFPEIMDRLQYLLKTQKMLREDETYSEIEVTVSPNTPLSESEPLQAFSEPLKSDMIYRALRELDTILWQGKISFQEALRALVMVKSFIDTPKDDLQRSLYILLHRIWLSVENILEHLTEHYEVFPSMFFESLVSLLDEDIAKNIMKHMMRGDDIRYEIYVYDEYLHLSLVETFLYPYHQQEAISFLDTLKRCELLVKQNKKKMHIQRVMIYSPRRPRKWVIGSSIQEMFQSMTIQIRELRAALFLWVVEQVRLKILQWNGSVKLTWIPKKKKKKVQEIEEFSYVFDFTLSDKKHLDCLLEAQKLVETFFSTCDELDVDDFEIQVK